MKTSYPSLSAPQPVIPSQALHCLLVRGLFFPAIAATTLWSREPFHTIPYPPVCQLDHPGHSAWVDLGGARAWTLSYLVNFLRDSAHRSVIVSALRSRRVLCPCSWSKVDGYRELYSNVRTRQERRESRHARTKNQETWLNHSRFPDLIILC